MFEYQTVYNGWTAFLAGAVTSVHCVAMCGPLSCAFSPAQRDDASVSLVLTCYHLAKLFAYMLVGLLAGAFGSLFLNAFKSSWLNYLPWVLVFFFFVVGFKLDRFLKTPVWLGKYYRELNVRFRALKKPFAAAMIGLASPLLPCGPLYMIFGLCLFSGSGVKGAEFALGFGLGTLPLLWLAQTQFMRLQHRLNPQRLIAFQRGAALVAALVLMWRLREMLGITTAVEWICS